MGIVNITGGKLRVARYPMASGSGGGGDGPPKQKAIVRMWNWLKAKMKKLFS
jgi:hypothetical protein